jgi:hypothetical protein
MRAEPEDRRVSVFKSIERTSIVAALALACLMAPPTAASFASVPELRIYPGTPDDVLPGQAIIHSVAIENVGDQATTGPITFVDATGPGLGAPEPVEGIDGQIRKCEFKPTSLTCVVSATLLPGGVVYVYTSVAAMPSATGIAVETFSASGGGVQDVAHGEVRMNVGPPGPYEFLGSEVRLDNADGSPAAQAAAVPAEYTTKLRWRSFYSGVDIKRSIAPIKHAKDVIGHLPPGLLGNPAATPALCTADQLAENYYHYNKPQNREGIEVPACPQESQIGIVRVSLGGGSWYTGLFNMVPSYGAATELGFEIAETPIALSAYVRPGDSGIDIISRNTSTTFPVPEAEVTVWGVPADHSHDPYRGLCLDSPFDQGPNGRICPSAVPPYAFLRNPTSCMGSPLAFGLESNSYDEPEVWIKASLAGPTMSGCESVPFSPDITADPTGTATNSPTGVSVKLSLPQNVSADGLATADLKKAVVTLPEGMVINPSSADGLQACDDAHLHLDSNTPAECPDGSKIGTVLLHTQLLDEPVEGSVYLRTQDSSDPVSGEMFRMAIELRDDARGLDFKIAGQVRADPVTGRLTTTFDDNPQLPFEDISLQFKSGARAPLVTPPSCVTQTTEADLYSWARPDEAVHRSSSFALTSGPGGTPCPGAVLPFAPSINVGVTNVQAGAFTSFLATFARSDADQSIQRVSVKMPKGLLGSLVGLPLCPEAQADAGTCSRASEIGSVTAGAGAGPTPFYVTGGKVFMTGPYEGAPFGLSVVVPAKAGPFDLGTVVVRSKVEVDIHTAQLMVTTDPLPQIVSGVPVNLRLVNVTINRPNFTYNPTDCEHAQVTGTMSGGQGTVAVLSNDFQVTNCGALKFQPHFAVSTSGKTSRADGARLDSKLMYPKTLQGTEANIAKVKVDLPKQLPSRLTTLQKACPAATFGANPAACPAPSRIGTATAITPVLPVPLSGPVYFVSHGGAAFPDLVIVLQGYGVTVDLVGTTFIGKAGITSTTFKTVPDVPVGTFELKLPQGPYSALAANGNLCKAKLAMPTLFVAQDGAEIHQATPIAVSGCARHVRRVRRKGHGKK